MPPKPKKTNKEVSFLPKSEILAKLSSGELISIPRAGGSKSSAWAKFHEVVQANDHHQYMNYVICASCKYLYKFRKGSSPATLLRHNCRSTSTEKSEDSNEPSSAKKLRGGY